MKKIICCSICFFASCILFGQSATDTTKTFKIKPHLASIIAKDGSTIEGWLLKAADDTVFLLPGRQLPKPVGGVYAQNMFANQLSKEVPQISVITVHKKNKVLRGAAIGLASGVVLGALLGFASGDDTVNPNEPFSGLFAYTAEEKAAGGAIGLGFTGALVGTIIGLVSKTKFIIGGDKQTYKQRQHELNIRSLAQ